MGGVFSKPKTPKAPKVPPPVAIPEEGTEAEEWALKMAKRGKGYRSTIVTGAFAPKPTGRKTALG